MDFLKVVTKLPLTIPFGLVQQNFGIARNRLGRRAQLLLHISKQRAIAPVGGRPEVMRRHLIFPESRNAPTPAVQDA